MSVRLPAEVGARVDRPHGTAGPVGPARGPAWAEVAGLAYATLPPWGRRLYALDVLPAAAALSDVAATVALRALRTALLGTTQRHRTGC
jgi:hypothetical protein